MSVTLTFTNEENDVVSTDLELNVTESNAVNIMAVLGLGISLWEVWTVDQLLERASFIKIVRLVKS